MRQFEELPSQTLRYGENPHQAGTFYGDLAALFDQLHGKELSYNNLVDVDAAVGLMDEFQDAGPTFAILKHTNACGIARRLRLTRPTSTPWPATRYRPLVALLSRIPSRCGHGRGAEQAVLRSAHCARLTARRRCTILQSKKNRILLKRKPVTLPGEMFKTILNGVLEQDKDNVTETASK